MATPSIGGAGAGGRAANGDVPKVPTALRVPGGDPAQGAGRRHPLQVRVGSILRNCATSCPQHAMLLQIRIARLGVRGESHRVLAHSCCSLPFAEAPSLLALPSKTLPAADALLVADPRSEACLYKFRYPDEVGQRAAEVAAELEAKRKEKKAAAASRRRSRLSELMEPFPRGL